MYVRQQWRPQAWVSRPPDPVVGYNPQKTSIPGAATVYQAHPLVRRYGKFRI